MLWWCFMHAFLKFQPPPWPHFILAADLISNDVGPHFAVRRPLSRISPKASESYYTFTGCFSRPICDSLFRWFSIGALAGGFRNYCSNIAQLIITFLLRFSISCLWLIAFFAIFLYRAFWQQQHNDGPLSATSLSQRQASFHQVITIPRLFLIFDTFKFLCYIIKYIQYTVTSILSASQPFLANVAFHAFD